MSRIYYLKKPPQAGDKTSSRQAWENTDHVVAQVQAFIRGVLADGVLNAAEATALHRLLNDRAETIAQIGFPLTDLMRRVEEFAQDGQWTPEELSILQTELNAFIAHEKGEEGPARASSHIFSDTSASIEFKGKEFIVTGQFAYGNRTKVIAAIEARGGFCQERPTRTTHYMVVGSFVSEGWAHGSYGRKIEYAIQLRDSSGMPHIISEEMWKSALEQA